MDIFLRIHVLGNRRIIRLHVPWAESARGVASQQLLAPGVRGTVGRGFCAARTWPLCSLTDRNYSQMERAGSFPGS